MGCHCCTTRLPPGGGPPSSGYNPPPPVPQGKRPAPHLSGRAGIASISPAAGPIVQARHPHARGGPPMDARIIPPEIHGGGKFLLRRRDFTPAYLRAHEEGRLPDKVAEALSHLGPSCRACPRLCKGVDRLADQFGVCKVGRHARVASAFPHCGEEAVLRVWTGSGTIFGARCNLHCVIRTNAQ